MLHLVIRCVRVRRDNVNVALDQRMEKKKGIPEIARLANVSLGTVSRALLSRKGVSKSTQERVLAIADAMGYKPNLAARALVKVRTPTLVGVCIPRELDHYFNQLCNGIIDEAARSEHLGIRLKLRPTERLGFGEADRATELIADGVRALIIVAGDPEGLAPVINEAEANDIRVICVDSDVQASSRSTTVSIDEEVSGRLAAELMGMLSDPGAEVAIITGMQSIELHRKNAAAFCGLFPQVCKGGKVVEIVDTLDEEDDAMRKCFTLLERRKTLTGIYVRTGNCLPVCRAISALDLSGKIQLITTDLRREMVFYFEKGVIHASINGRTYMQGQVAMRLVVDHLVRGQRLPAQYRLNPQIVLRSNLHLFREVRPTRAEKSAVLLQGSQAADGTETTAHHT